MKISNRFIYFRAIAISLLLMGSACSGGGSLAETPTLSPLPTGTPVVVPTSLLTATSTVQPVPTQHPAKPGTIAMDQDEVSVRSGPNTLSPRVGTLKAGEDVQILGKLVDNGWLEIAFPSAPNGIAWVYSVLVSVNGNDIPVVATDGSPAVTSTPNNIPIDPKAIAAIRKFTQQQGSDIIYVGKTDFIAMGPELEKTVARYTVDGVDYDLDPLTYRVVAYHITPTHAAGASVLSVDELYKMAQQFVTAQIPGIQLQSLNLEKNNKGENYWFRWSKSSIGPGYFICVQAGYTDYGQLFDYNDSLPADVVK